MRQRSQLRSLVSVHGESGSPMAPLQRQFEHSVVVMTSRAEISRGRGAIAKSHFLEGLHQLIKQATFRLCNVQRMTGREDAVNYVDISAGKEAGNMIGMMNTQCFHAICMVFCAVLFPCNLYDDMGRGGWLYWRGRVVTATIQVRK